MLYTAGAQLFCSSLRVNDRFKKILSGQRQKRCCAKHSHAIEILERLEACDDLYFDSASQIRTPAWSTGRIVLVGDAAYCPCLLSGEGAGLALAGAYLLAGELQRAGGDHTMAFRAYERRFRDFIERKQQSAEQFATSFTPKTHLGLFVRDLVLRLTALPMVSNPLMHRFVTDRFQLPDYPD
jgi:hypothetical protein